MLVSLCRSHDEVSRVVPHLHLMIAGIGSGSPWDHERRISGDRTWVYGWFDAERVTLILGADSHWWRHRTTRYVVFVVVHWLRCFPVSRSPKSPFLRVAHCHRGAVLTWGALWQGGGAMLRTDGCNKIRPGVIHYMIDTLVSGINYTYEISAFDLQYLTKPFLTRQTGSFVMKVRSQTSISEDDLSLEGSCRDWAGILAPQISCQRDMNTFHLWKNSLTFWKKKQAD